MPTTTNPQYKISDSLFDFCFSDDDFSEVNQIVLKINKSDAATYPAFLHLVISEFKKSLIKHYEVSCGKDGDAEWIKFLRYQYQHAQNKRRFLNIVDEFLKTEPTESNTDWFYEETHKWLIEEKLLLDITSETNEDEQISTVALPENKWMGKTNTFNRMPLPEVANYFHKELSGISRHNRAHLSSDQIDQFIERAFTGNENIEPLCLNYCRGEKGKLIDVFFKYYEICTTDYQHENTIHSKAKYQSLIDDNFSNMGTYNFRRK